MSDKFRRVIAWIAVGFAVVFSLSFILYMIDPHMLNDTVTPLTVISGGITLALFLVVKLENRNKRIEEEQKKLEEEQKNARKKHADKQKEQENKDE